MSRERGRGRAVQKCIYLYAVCSCVRESYMATKYTHIALLPPISAFFSCADCCLARLV